MNEQAKWLTGLTLLTAVFSGVLQAWPLPSIEAHSAQDDALAKVCLRGPRSGEVQQSAGLAAACLPSRSD